MVHQRRPAAWAFQILINIKIITDINTCHYYAYVNLQSNTHLLGDSPHCQAIKGILLWNTIVSNERHPCESHGGTINAGGRMDFYRQINLLIDLYNLIQKRLSN